MKGSPKKDLSHISSLPSFSFAASSFDLPYGTLLRVRNRNAFLLQLVSVLVGVCPVLGVARVLSASEQ